MKACLSTVLVALLAATTARSDPPPARKVLIIGIDGTMPAALAVADTPNIDALKAAGSFSDRAITHPVTHSASCWSAMFTGVWGDKHAVNNPNNNFSGNQFAAYPNFMKRLEQADSSLSTVAYLRWSPLSTALAGTDEVTSFGSDSAITTATVNKLTNGDPDVFYTILLDVDSTGHSAGWGPSVPGYVAAIETADARVGQIISALTSRPTYAQEDWLVIVLSDHGKHDDVLELSRITFHLVWGPSAATGIIRPSPSIVDVCATVLTHTCMLERSTQGFLPAGTRLVEFQLSMQSASGVNQASADTLSFVIYDPAVSHPRIVAMTPNTHGWQVQFQSRFHLFYELHRSPDLQSWSRVDGPIPGDGTMRTLSDTSAPGGRAFYQVIGISP